MSYLLLNQIQPYSNGNKFHLTIIGLWHTSRYGVIELDKILKILSSLMFYSNVGENALSR